MMLRMFRIRSRRAKIALISAFGAIIIAARLYELHSDRPGVAGTIANVAVVIMLIGGAIALFIGFRSLDWNQVGNKRRRP
jgi:hypothetical protein